MIFEPSWNLQIGEQQTRGMGLLHKPLWPSVDDFDLFSVTLNGTQLIVLPKEGKIMQNLQTLWEGAKGKLIWFRRMQMEFGSGPVKRDCSCYGIGIENGERHGFRLYADGRVEEGLG